MNLALKNKYLQILIHIIAWGVFLALLTTLVPRPQRMDSFLSVLIPFIFFASFFYFNFYILVPRYFIPKKYFSFTLICLICLLLTIIVPSLISELYRPVPPMPGPASGFGPHPVPPFMDRPMPGPPPHERLDLFQPEFGYTIIVFFLMFTISLGIRIINQWQEAEKEKANAELAFLKAQINPHFLFNTLNTIYSLAVSKAEKTSYAIEKFSEMMRFVINEACHDFVPLSRKIEYIDTYIALQKLRLPPSVQVNYQKTGNPASLQIAPLIMMPFIENAFKYGISTEKESKINIKIEIDDDKLNLTVRNLKFTSQNKENGTSQLGINNTIKRLLLIYPGKHNLHITDSESEFNVLLNLQLK